MSEAPAYQKLFAEFKRRRVFRVAAMYGAAAFVVLQVADLLQEGLQLPQVVLTVVTIASLVGFPVALLLAWMYERTPHGVVRTSDPAPDEIERIVAEPRARRWPVGIAAATGTALLLLGSWWALGRPVAPGVEHGEYSSIAVLPFDNMSGNDEDAYFADGLSEELLNALTRVPGLRVAGRTSSFALRNASLDIPAIGDTLNVETVLEGSVRRAGGRVRVTAQLVDARDGFHIWSRDWEKELTAENVFEIQDEIATAVASAVGTGDEPEVGSRARPGGSGAADLVPERVRTSDLDTYDLYLTGRYHWASRDPERLSEAVRLFEAALARDSSYAPAWVGLSAVYNALPWYTDYPVREAAERSKSAARRALELDPENAEALYTLATTLFELDREWREASELYYRALDLDPQYSQGLTWYCYYLFGVGRWEEGLPWCERAVELDPLRMHGVMGLGEELMTLGRVEEGLRVMMRALALEPDNVTSTIHAAIGNALLGRTEEAEEYLGRYGRLVADPNGDALAAAIVNALEDPAARGQAVEAIHAWESQPETQLWMVINWLVIIGAREQALTLVDRMVVEEPADLSGLNSSVFTRLLRGEPRFDAAIAALGIPDPPPPAYPLPNSEG
jgi:TolB-like protein/Tfp pilus assembly protein PilF